ELDDRGRVERIGVILPQLEIDRNRIRIPEGLEIDHRRYLGRVQQERHIGDRPRAGQRSTARGLRSLRRNERECIERTAERAVDRSDYVIYFQQTIRTGPEV